MPARVTTETDDMPDDLAEATNEPSLQSLLDQFTGQSGWAEMDTATIGKILSKQLREQQARLRKDALVFRECFSTPAGRRVLQILLDETLRRVVWPVGAMGNMQDLTGYGVWREGQNAFAANIVEAIAFANNSDVKPRSTP